MILADFLAEGMILTDFLISKNAQVDVWRDALQKMEKINLNDIGKLILSLETGDKKNLYKNVNLTDSR